jgi:hypothetical protein
MAEDFLLMKRNACRSELIKLAKNPAIGYRRRNFAPEKAQLVRGTADHAHPDH